MGSLWSCLLPHSSHLHLVFPSSGPSPSSLLFLHGKILGQIPSFAPLVTFGGLFPRTKEPTHPCALPGIWGDTLSVVGSQIHFLYQPSSV